MGDPEETGLGGGDVWGLGVFRADQTRLNYRVPVKPRAHWGQVTGSPCHLAKAMHRWEETGKLRMFPPPAPAPSSPAEVVMTRSTPTILKALTFETTKNTGDLRTSMSSPRPFANKSTSAENARPDRAGTAARGRQHSDCVCVCGDRLTPGPARSPVGRRALREDRGPQGLRTSQGAFSAPGQKPWIKRGVI